jgi:transposase InsO family protein
MDRVVDDIGRRALLVAEMHRRKPLALQSVRGERTGDTISLLQRLIDVHGPPLVLKVDNGSAFIAKRLADFCDGHGMVLMHSPIRQPRWNGTCEVLGRWTKKRAAAAAAARRSLSLAQADLDAAVGVVKPLPPVSAELRARFAEHFRRELAHVTSEQGLASDAVLPDHLRRSLRRVAAQRALQLCHILTIEGRAYRQWIPTPAA